MPDTPNPFASLEQSDRFYHLDIPDLPDSELRDELYHLYPLLWKLPMDNWFRERVAMLEQELRERKREAKYEEFRGQTKIKAKPAEGVKL